MTHSPHRIHSLDALRGLAIAGMIVVSSPGNDEGYAWTRHSAWHGWTLADMVFPAFLFVMGVSLAVSLGRRKDRGEPTRSLTRLILWRAGAIMGLGLLGSAVLALGSGDPLRLPGVLQRIALCYAACALLYLRTGPLTQALVAVAALLLYWLALLAVPVPSYGPGVLTPEGNLASWLDRSLFGEHLSAPFHDPEGLLGSLPACANAVFGGLTGQWLRSNRSHQLKFGWMLSFGLLSAAAGLLWGLWLPVNKSLWTGSFALLSTGAALASLSLIYWLMDVRGVTARARPLEVFGANPLISYFLSMMLYGLQEFVKVQPDGNLKLWLCWTFFGRLGAPGASLAYSLAFGSFCWLLMYQLYRRRIFVKI